MHACPCQLGVLGRKSGQPHWTSIFHRARVRSEAWWHDPPVYQLFTVSKTRLTRSDHRRLAISTFLLYVSNGGLELGVGRLTDALVVVVEGDALVDVAPVGPCEVGLDAGAGDDVDAVLGVVERLEHGDERR